MHFQCSVLLDALLLFFWRTLDHWTLKWRNRIIFYDTHYTVLSPIVMLNYLEPFWLPVIGRLPFSALLYLVLARGATRILLREELENRKFL